MTSEKNKKSEKGKKIMGAIFDILAQTADGRSLTFPCCFSPKGFLKQFFIIIIIKSVFFSFFFFF